MVETSCLTVSKVLHRSKRTPFVKAYLEGVPKSEKVIDRIAGADLRSGVGIDFFTTAPRYVDVRREQRLSTMFFHHILYPAGGARAPYQPVVVRGGRSLRRRVYPVPSPFPCAGHYPLTARETNPSFSSVQQCLQDTSEALWASVDPAVPTFFFSPRDPKSSLFHARHHSKSMRWNIHEEENRAAGSSSAFRSRGPPSRFPTSPPRHTVEHCDSALSLLVGAIEDYLNEPSADCRFPEDPSRPSSFSHPGTSSPLLLEKNKIMEEGKAGPEKQKRVREKGNTLLSPSSNGCVTFHSPALERVRKLLLDSHAGFIFFGPVREGNRPGRSRSVLEGIRSPASLSSFFSSKNGNQSTPTLRLSERSAYQEAQNVFAHVCQEYWSTHTEQLGSLPSKDAGKRDTIGYVALQLPEEVVVKMPLPTCEKEKGSATEKLEEDHKMRTSLDGTFVSRTGGASRSSEDDERKQFSSMEVCRLAGGVELCIPFAVGRPVSKHNGVTSHGTSPSTSSSSLALSQSLFPHLQFLARITIRVDGKPLQTALPSVVERGAEKSEEEGTKELEMQRKDTDGNEGITDSFFTPFGLESEGRKTTIKEEKDLSLLERPLEKHTAEEFGPLTIAPECGAHFDGTTPGVLGTQVDPMIPARLRMLVEKGRQKKKSGTENAAWGEEREPPADPPPSSFSSSASSPFVTPAAAPGRIAIGREDAELYFIPYRALVLTILVPSWTEEMCREQNRARARRQRGVHHETCRPSAPLPDLSMPSDPFAVAGRPGDQRNVGHPGATRHLPMAFVEIGREGEEAEDFRVPYTTPESGRFTWGRKIHLQEQIARMGESRKRETSGATEGGGRRLETGQLAYEVKALPGDVIYIPRGWGMEVRRVVGSCIVTPSSSCISLSPSLFSSRPHWESNRPKTSAIHASQDHQKDLLVVDEQNKKEKEPNNPPNMPESSVKVEVDGFFVSYRPYPVLTNEQASVYVSANYVQSKGITEFYEQGGNNVFHHYE